MRRRGFTLIEILIALAMVAMLFLAMTTLLFSMGELWGRGGEQHLYEMHVRNATRFVENQLRAAGLPPANADGSAFKVDDVRDSTGRSQTLLTFVLPAGSRICEWPDRPLPDVTCALTVRRGEGLFLLWHSQLEKRFLDDAPRETLITPWVTDIDYEYFETDFKNWKSENIPRKDSGGKGVVPQRLKLTFSYEGRTMVMYVAVPIETKALPQL